MRELLLRDALFAVRSLRRSPAFSLVAIVTLGLAVGAATTIFSVVNGVLLQPLPYARPAQIVIVWNDFGKSAQSLPVVSATDYLDYRRDAHLFDGFAAGAGAGAVGATGILTDHGAPERVDVTPVSANFFPLLGVEPILGRQFTEGEEAFHGPNVVILSHALWRRRFAADSGIVGKTIQLDGVAHTVVGVLPESFRLALPAEVYQMRSGEIWKPLQFDRGALPPRNLTTFTVLGRLKANVTLGQAQAEMDGIAQRFRVTYPEHRASQVRIRVVPLQQDVVKGVRPALLILMAAAGLLVLIACANVANLFAARAVARDRELAIRAAVGASRGQLMGRLLMEGVELAALGSGLGLVLTYGGLAWLGRLDPAHLPRLANVRVDWNVALFTAVVGLGTVLLFGLAPAFQAARARSGELLRGASRVHGVRGRGSWRSGLIVGEIAMSLVLLIGAGLLLRSFLAVETVRPGFDPAGALTFRISLPGGAYPDLAQREPFYNEVERRIAALPGVVAVGAASQLPLTGSGDLAPYAYNEETARNWESVTAEGRWVSPDYFRAIGTRILTGRAFTRDDRANNASHPGSQVIIVDQTLASRAWPNENAVGKRLQVDETGSPRQFATVIGVAEHTHIRELADEGLPQIYRALWPGREETFVVRSVNDPATLVGLVRREIAAIDPALPVEQIAPLANFVADALAGRRLSLLLMQGVSALALLLATIGVYGVVAHTVGQREREFGVRIALGETPAGLTRMVLLEGLRLIIPSISLGLALALGGTRLLGGLLYGVSAIDLRTFAVASALLAGIALMACYVPARRASRVRAALVLRSG